MQLLQSKLGGLLFLTIGVALCAAYGARQSDSMYTYLQTQLNTAAARAEAKNAFNRYNDMRTQESLKPISSDSLPKLSLAKAMTINAREMKANEFINALTKISGPHADKLEETRQAWLRGEKLAITFELKTLSQTLPSPTTRLTEWLASSGLIFLAGIALIICGAVLTRRTRDGHQQAVDNSDGQPLDIRAISNMLHDLHERVSTLSAEARDIQGPTRADANALKARIENLQLSHFEPLVASRNLIQQQIGLTAFAEMFSPFSSGERNINRAWSTLVDEHWSECLSSLGRASLAIKRADESLKQTLDTHTSVHQS
ncbi:MAG: hypothetical protein ACPGQS_05800 [Bradymonadia bacterium]